jgi:hypothetical protein
LGADETMDQTNLDIYGSAPLPWSRALDELKAGGPAGCWLATTRPDGRPHVAGVGAKWIDDRLYFVSGEFTRKSQNLAGNPNCAISMCLPGLDLVVEGAAMRVTDEATVARIAERYAADGWPASASGDVITAPYSAPSAGPPPWNLYAVRPATAYGVATAEPYGATRWRFG